jgi:enoyl-CoA hydratase
MSYQFIRYQVIDSLALITLNRPDKLNAVSLGMLSELHSAVDAAQIDEQVRVIGITGAGDKAFAAGSDLAEVKERDLKKALEPIVQGLAEKLERCNKVSIAAINGICFGGGLEVALGCDLRLATPNATFATPEGKLGIIPGGGATQRLPRLVGRAWAMEMLIMGEPIDADRALHIGLVTRMVDSEKLLPELSRMAEHISAFAPLVPQFMKAMINYGMEGSSAAGLAMEKFAQSALCSTPDKEEGLSAFLEKRTPVWKK